MIDKIVDFIMQNTTYTDRASVRKFVIGHMMYRTCFVPIRNVDVVGYIRWNILPDGVIHVCDCIIKKDYRWSGVLEEMIERMSAVMPEAKRVIFERGYDDGLQNKKLRKYDVERIMRRVKKCSLSLY